MTTDFGVDIATPDAADIDPYFSTVTGWRGLGQALARRLVTPRGSLIDDDAYGYDLRSRLNDTFTASDLAQLGAVVRRELEADERVESAMAAVTFARGTLTVRAAVQTADGPFRLVLAVSSVTTEILAAEPV
mgnify:FL=1